MVEIIAEIGASHLGSIENAKKLIEIAKNSGADAVKLQTFLPELMCPANITIESGPWKGWNMRELYERCKTPHEWHEELFNFAQNIVGIKIFSSVFDSPSLKLLESLGCERYKISSFDICDHDLLRIVAETEKPVILSTGMTPFAEINRARMAFWNRMYSEITFLHCVSAYPAPVEDMRIERMNQLRSLGHVNVGLSDHSNASSMPAIMAIAAGATMIEKHIQLRNEDLHGAWPASRNPDHSFALEPVQFAAFVYECRQAEKIMGNGDLDLFNSSEFDQLPLKKSLFYTTDLKAGENVAPWEVAAMRPGHGAPLGTIVAGKRVKMAVKAGDPVILDNLTD